MEAVSVMMTVIGRKDMNFPGIPGINMRGKKGAIVVSVPVKTAAATSPTPRLAAAVTERSGVVVKWRYTFSTTTIELSTTIPKTRIKDIRTTMFKVKPMTGIKMKAMIMDIGMAIPTNRAFVSPMKNMRIKTTTMNPRMTVLKRSLMLFFV
jgi:hypothetical protein